MPGRVPGPWEETSDRPRTPPTGPVPYPSLISEYRCMYLDDHPVPSATHHPTLAIFGSGEQSAPRTLTDIARTTMARHPDAVAVDCADAQLTYAEFSLILDEQVSRLHLHGVGRGDTVGIRVPSGTLQLYVAALAVAFAGATSVPVDLEAPEGYAQAVWEAAGVRVVYGPDLGLTAMHAVTGEADTSGPEPEDDAWIMFSGPADALQPMATTHRSAAAVADAQAIAYLRDAPVGPGDRVMTRNTIASPPSAKEMWLSWRRGATLVPVSDEVADSPETLPAWVLEQRITVAAVAPSVAATWPRQVLDQLRLLILVGQDTGWEVLEQLHRPGLEIWTGYRSTWTAARLYDGLTLTSPRESVGGPIPGMRLTVVDAAGEPVPWGGTGEVVTTGPLLDRHLDPATDAALYPPLPSLGWERARHTGVLVRAERDRLIPVDEHGSPTRVPAPQRRRRWWSWR